MDKRRCTTVMGRKTCFDDRGILRTGPYELAQKTFSTSGKILAQKAASMSKAPHFKPHAYSPPTRKVPNPAPKQRIHPLQPQDTLRFTKVPLILGGLVAFAISGYSAYVYVSYKRAVASGTNSNIPADVSERYNSIASGFDSSVDYTEKLMGLNRMRKKLAQEATGDVCEVSIGTGRNLTYYDWDFNGHNGVGRVGSDRKIKRGKVNSFTAVDKSAEMLEVAHDKFSKEYPGVLGIRWVIQDASKPLPSPPVSASEVSGNKVGKKYDTIIQTMGLCSTGDPVGLLVNLGKSIEPGGRILLLEHGQGTWSFINTILDGLAARHASEFGCWWNRDIGKIVQDSGLEVVEIKRKHFGTTWWVELRAKKVESEKHATAAKEEVETTIRPNLHPVKKGSWW